ncbi:PapB family radical SAM/SPASM ranthipeptide maturase [Paramaledivibacter caminithermalis]|uniref:Radical SAM core domain-containing protein n=1 Tax=Paramaledivibacter caminithermalis (strain DSM 15212 / CIP 107654 / DViRD3) TaxID=1121301 RepID=A0A1M6TFT8_PARC5|nr:radical SAM protein [Paramaledivibacter caminithermalis]SHK55739.1 uncharacterized protein SAMN02745912_03671 [Paramaledivibacter caminithermalis DSM 15212]
MENIAGFKLGKFRIWEFRDKIYLYVIKTVAIFEIDEKIRAILEKNKNILDLSSYDGDKEELCQAFERAGLIEMEKSNKISVLDKGVSSVTLLLSQVCNLRCTYCYAEGGEYHNRGFMSKETAKCAIDYIFDNSNKKYINIILFGGEPLLNFDLFKYCVEYGKKKAKEVGKKVTFSTTTNGTLLNKEIGEFLHNNKFTITLSIDGDAATHNQNRYDVKGNGTYSLVMNNVREYLDVKKITARATLTHCNTAIDQIYDHLYSLGFGNIHISPSINMMSEDDYDKLALGYETMVYKFKKALDEKNYDYCLKNSNILTFLNRFYGGGIREKFCGAVNNMIAVDIDGSIFGCHRLVEFEDSSYGDIESGYKQSNRDKLLAEISKNDRNQKCTECWAKSLCGGGCPAENKVANGDFKVPHEHTCNLLRKNAELALKLYVGLTDEEKLKLFEKEEVYGEKK